MIHGQFFRVNMLILLLIMLAGVSSILGHASLPRSFLKVKTVQNKVPATETEQAKNLILQRYDSLTEMSDKWAEMETQVPAAQRAETRFIQTNLQEIEDKTVKMKRREPIAQTVEKSDLTQMSDNYLLEIHRSTERSHRKLPEEQIVEALGSIRVKSDPGSIQSLNAIMYTHNNAREVPTSQEVETANLIEISNNTTNIRNGTDEVPPALNKDTMDSIQMKRNVVEVNNKCKEDSVAESSDTRDSIQIFTEITNPPNIATKVPAAEKEISELIWKSKSLLETQNYTKGKPITPGKEELTQASKQAPRFQNVPKRAAPTQKVTMDLTQAVGKVAARNNTKELQGVHNVEETNWTLVRDDLATKSNDKTSSFQTGRRSTETKKAAKGITVTQVLNAADSTIKNTDFSAVVGEKTAEDFQKSGIPVVPQKIAEELPTAWKVQTADLTLKNDDNSKTSKETAELDTRAPPICEPVFRCITFCLSGRWLRRQESGSERHRRNELDLEMGPLMRSAPPQRPLQEPQPPLPQRQPQIPRPPPPPRKIQPWRTKIVRPSDRNIPDPKSKSRNTQVL